MKDVSDNKSTTRWRDFSDEELRIIAYGLAQIHGDQIIEKLLDEINPLVFPVKKEAKPSVDSGCACSVDDSYCNCYGA